MAAQTHGDPREVCGVLCLNKPAGITSRDAVNLIQRLGRRLKVGHAGTLDPLATGVLVVCVGRATRLIPLVQELPKHYRATFLLGRSSPTDDIEGHITFLENPPVPSGVQIEETIPSFLGTILQRPPVYSAVKIQGRRGYDWARAGAPQEPAARPVQVHEIAILRYDYPELELEIKCGSGTYVRSLGRDLAARLGTAAVMSKLVRLAVGHFWLEDAVDPRSLGPHNWRDVLLPAVTAVRHLPHIQLEREQLTRLLHGQSVRHPSPLKPGQKAAIVTRDGQLQAVVECLNNQVLKPLINFGNS